MLKISKAFSSSSKTSNDHSFKQSVEGETLLVSGEYEPVVISNKKQITLLSIFCILNVFAASSTSLISPFYPDVAIERDVHEKLIGIIFSIGNLFSIFIIILIGKKLQVWGKKRIYVFGIIFLIIGTFLFGFVILIKNKELFIAVSLLARILEGFGMSGITTVAFAYAPSLFPNSSQEKIGYLEASESSGYLIGPLIGSGIYVLFGYQICFYFIVGLLMILLIIVLKVVPKDDTFEKKNYNFFFLFKNWKILFLTLIVLFSTLGNTYMQPIIALHLHTFGVDTKYVPLFFLLNAITFAITASKIEKATKVLGNKRTIFMGLIMLGIANILVGPQEKFYLKNSIWLVGIALCLAGFGFGFTLLPTFSESIKTAKVINKDLDDEILGDFAAFLYNFSYTAGEFIGPFLGGYLSQEIGFVDTSSCFGIFMLITAILILLLIYSDYQEEQIHEIN